MNCTENDCSLYKVCSYNNTEFNCPCLTCLKNPVCKHTCIDFCLALAIKKKFYKKSESMSKIVFSNTF
jgi:hypothetical protein